MISASQYMPDWASAPGETIRDILDDRNVSVSDFARVMGSSKVDIVKLLSGELLLSAEVAKALAENLGGSEAFWLRREEDYRDCVERLQSRGASNKSDKTWLKSLPLADMDRFGWFSVGSSFDEKLASCLNFFGVDSTSEWEDRYGDLLETTAFRTSTAFATDNYAVVAWLRQGERIAFQYPSDEWNPLKFEQSLEDIRKLSKLKDPNVFVPKLREICAASGVSVAFVRSPKGCRASGATRFLPNGKPLIMLSFRYLTDDHFWFTFMHEAAHLILHAETPLHLEGIEVDSDEEDEANHYAALSLIPAHLQPELLDLRTDKKAIMRFAVRAKVSAGIVVGQLQHIGNLGPDQMNWLKKRFKWSDILIE